MKKKFYILFLCFFSISTIAQVESVSIEDYFNKIKNDHKKLMFFLNAMPKGGDLHNHLDGNASPQDILLYKNNKKLCVNKNTNAIIRKPYCYDYLRIENIKVKSQLYDILMDAWSMRHPNMPINFANAHFFSIFSKTYLGRVKNRGQTLSDTVVRAKNENINYLELMVNPDEESVSSLVNKINNLKNYEKIKCYLLKAGIMENVYKVEEQLNNIDNFKNNSLFCNTQFASKGCTVTVRYIYQVLREQNDMQFFSQLLEAFLLVKDDKEVVGITLVGNESSKLSIKSYKIQMKMIKFLRKEYPNVHITLHAGEIGLNSIKVLPQAARSHIQEAVEIADAERIGHGVDIVYEKNPLSLLKEMANKNVLVEINLTSNKKILGISSNAHPLPLYLQYGVPVTLSTDDSGILGNNLTCEYFQAVTKFHVPYSVLKEFARNSLTFSFLDGDNFWLNFKNHIPVVACQNQKFGNLHSSASCSNFLMHSHKAEEQWLLENQLYEFEKHKVKIVKEAHL